MFPRFLRGRSGAAAVEAAIALPFLAALLVGTFEFGRFALLNAKLDETSSALAQMVSALPVAKRSLLDRTLENVTPLAAPFAGLGGFAGKGRVIVSSVSLSRTAGESELQAVVNWQVQGGGSLAASSRVGVPGGVPTLNLGGDEVGGGSPASFNETYTLIVVETFFSYESEILDLGIVETPIILEKRSLARVRERRGLTSLVED